MFAARVRKPARTYIAGVSMGGLITLDLAERFPGKYDGALAICGVVGGSRIRFQREGDGRVLFTYFLPGVLPRELLQTPILDYSVGSPIWNAIAGTLAAGLAAPGQTTMQFANAAGLTGSNPSEIIYSALSLFGNGYNEMLQRTHGHNFYDNTHTIYRGSANDAALNAHGQRFHADWDGVNFLAECYTPTASFASGAYHLYDPGSDCRFLPGGGIRSRGRRRRLFQVPGSAVR